MGAWWSKPTTESPAMDAIVKYHRKEGQKEDPESRETVLESQKKALENEKKALEAAKKDLERKNASLEAQLQDLEAKAKTTDYESLQMKARLLDEKTKVDEMTESLRLVDEYTHHVRPTQWPTPEQFEATKRQYSYSPEKFHIAISGQSGTGKSSLINALRGLYPEDGQAAATGVVECTKNVTRYLDPDPNKSLVWFDVPGAGTQSHPEAEYFNDKGLYMFDAILVIFDVRFGSTDIAILRQCRLYGIPSFIVRSKADVHVRNGYQIAENREKRKCKKKKGGALSTDEKARLLDIEKRSFEIATRESVNQELTVAGLPIQPVFVVSSEGLLSTVRGKRSNAVVEIEDEGVAIESDWKHNDGAERDGAWVGDEDVDEDGDEDVPYVIFDEERLLADLIHTSCRTRVAKDSWWLGSMLNLLWRKAPSPRNIFKNRSGNKAHQSGQGTT